MLIDQTAYFLLLVPASAVVFLAFYYCTWLSWELFINN